ncbi:hypothetical protein EI94DRAFT_1706782 [Lactarius quietus]|nr:hypothetical protein EI94DRAFT_1706782 [Lactarius quietus]
MEYILSASRSNQRFLRKKYRCAITKAFDRTRAEKVDRKERSYEIPDGPQLEHTLQVAHIILSLLNNHYGKVTISSEIIDRCSHLGHASVLDPNRLEEDDIFRHFRFYLDKEASSDTPNKYRLHMHQSTTRLSDGFGEVDVEFPTLEESTVASSQLSLPQGSRCLR